MAENKYTNVQDIFREFSRNTAQVARCNESVLLQTRILRPTSLDEIEKVPPPIPPRSVSVGNSTKKINESSNNRWKADIKPYGSDRKMIKEKLVSIYDDILRILKSPEYDANLQRCLERAFPDNIACIEKRKRDICEADHGIIISGETSAGKSTLINKILGTKLFKGRNRESTSTVCKIRNSDEVKVKTEMESGAVSEIDVPEIDVGSKEGEKELRKILKRMTDMTIVNSGTKYRSVDIGIPVPFLEENTIIVDTPGIGGSGTVTRKLMDYLPNAVSFIFVINVANAGGMQQDRLPEILRAITNLQSENEMPCFDPSRVIFVTNKWDSIENDSDDSSEEDEVEKTWQSVTKRIHRLWPSVRNENIFRMNLKEVCCEHSPSSKEFKKFRHALETVIKENESFRIECHFRYISSLLDAMSKGIYSKLKLVTRTKQEQEKKKTEHQKKIQELKTICRSKRTVWQNRIRRFIEEQAYRSLEYMSSDLGKERILNPAKWKPIMKISYAPKKLGQEVENRVAEYIESIVRCPEVVGEFQELKDRILEFCEEMSLEIEKMENEWTGLADVEEKASVSEKEQSVMPYIAGAFATPILFPMMVAGAAVAVAAAPLALPLVAIWASNGNKRRIVDEKYDKYKLTIRSSICNALETHYGEAFDRIITNVTQREMQRKIDFIEEILQQLAEHREEILANQERIFILVQKIAPLPLVLEDIKQMLCCHETDFN